jgi:hypothetical protein
MINSEHAIWFQTKHLPMKKSLYPDHVKELRAAAGKNMGRCWWKVYLLQNKRSHGSLIAEGRSRNLPKAMKAVFWIFDEYKEINEFIKAS